MNTTNESSFFKDYSKRLEHENNILIQKQNQIKYRLRLILQNKKYNQRSPVYDSIQNIIDEI